LGQRQDALKEQAAQLQGCLPMEAVPAMVRALNRVVRFSTGFC
jgi:hypothetical protein